MPMSGDKNKSRIFYICISIIGGLYVLLLVLMLSAQASYFSPPGFLAVLKKPEIQFSIKLSLLSCSVSALISVWIAIPLGYLMSRYSFFGRSAIDVLIHVPIVLPPLVVGCCLLVLFNYPPFSYFGQIFVFNWPGVILAQFVVACALSVRTMRLCYDQIPERYEKVALTLGCHPGSAFQKVVLPQAKSGILESFTIAWARSLGEFGPILVFAGATSGKTEVLSTSFFLSMQAGDMEGMISISTIMVVCAVFVLSLASALGRRMREE